MTENEQPTSRKELRQSRRKWGLQIGGLALVGALGLGLGGSGMALWTGDALLIPGVKAAEFKLSSEVTRFENYVSSDSVDEWGNPSFQGSPSFDWRQVGIDDPVAAATNQAWFVDVTITNTGDNMKAELVGTYGDSKSDAPFSLFHTYGDPDLSAFRGLYMLTEKMEHSEENIQKAFKWFTYAPVPPYVPEPDEPGEGEEPGEDVDPAPQPEPEPEPEPEPVPVPTPEAPPAPEPPAKPYHFGSLSEDGGRGYAFEEGLWEEAFPDIPFEQHRSTPIDVPHGTSTYTLVLIGTVPILKHNDEPLQLHYTGGEKTLNVANITFELKQVKE